MHDKRLTDRLTSYWSNIRKEKPYPEIQHFNPSAVEDVWAYCFRLKVEPAAANVTTRTYRYEYMGAKIIEAYGKNLSGQSVSSAVRMLPGSDILKKVDMVLANSTPLYEGGQFVNDKNKIVKYRSCMLPFGNETAGVTHIVVGLSWKSF